MKIETDIVFYIEHEGVEYMRSSGGTWSELMGCSWEDVPNYREEPLEKEFQKELKKDNNDI